jgi:hypothetical protein
MKGGRPMAPNRLSRKPMQFGVAVLAHYGEPDLRELVKPPRDGST